MCVLVCVCVCVCVHLCVVCDCVCLCVLLCLCVCVLVCVVCACVCDCVGKYCLAGFAKKRTLPNNTCQEEGWQAKVGLARSGREGRDWQGSFRRARLAGRVWQDPAKRDLPKETCQRRPAKRDLPNETLPKATLPFIPTWDLTLVLFELRQGFTVQINPGSYLSGSSTGHCA